LCKEEEDGTVEMSICKHALEEKILDNESQYEDGDVEVDDN
jgi:hypothetical protein